MNHRLRVGIVTPAFFYMPTWAATEKGWYAALGLEVEVIDKGGIDAVTKGLLAGELDIGIGSPEHVIHDVEAGGPLRMVGGNVNRLTHSLITQPEIRTLEDLRGKTIGVSALSGGTSSLFVHILERAGLKYPGDYTMVEAGPVPPRHKKLMAREIDAGMQTDPHNYMAEDAGLHNLGPLARWIPDFQFTSINVRRDWAAAHAQALVRFLQATIEGSRCMATERSAAVDIAERYMRLPRPYLDRAWADHCDGAVALDLHLNRAGLETALQLMRRDRTGTVHLAADARPEKYVEGRYLQEAQRAAGLPQHIFA